MVEISGFFIIVSLLTLYHLPKLFLHPPPGLDYWLHGNNSHICVSSSDFSSDLQNEYVHLHLKGTLNWTCPQLNSSLVPNRFLPCLVRLSEDTTVHSIAQPEIQGSPRHLLLSYLPHPAKASKFCPFSSPTSSFGSIHFLLSLLSS